jgi:hypothetical protein
MRHVFLAAVLLFLIGFLPYYCFSESNSTETLTLTTYYPSPMGIYRDLEVKRSVKFAPLSQLPDKADSTEGQLIFMNNTVTQGFYYFDGEQWRGLMPLMKSH